MAIEQLADLFDKTQVAELASYAQIAAERVQIIKQLQSIIDEELDENKFQELLAKANWLIEPSWTAISMNQSLKTFKHNFEQFWKKKYKSTVNLAISHEDKRPDFTLVSLDRFLHIVEIKKAGHDFNDADFERLHVYVVAFDEFFAEHAALSNEFDRGWRITLIADGEKLKKAINKTALEQIRARKKLERITWVDFLTRTTKAHEKFLDAHDAAKKYKSTAKKTAKR